MLLFTLLLDDKSSSADISCAELLFKKYNKQVYYLAKSVVKKHENAEDIVQKTFIRIIKNLHKLADTDSPQTKHFIMKIAYREALREYSVERKVEMIPYEDYIAAEDGKDPSDNVWDSFAETYDRTKLKEALKKLPEHYQMLIIYKYTYGYSYKDISDMLDMSVSNVSVQLTRARQKLFKTYLEDNASTSAI